MIKTPVFAGRNNDGELFVLYKEVRDEDNVLRFGEPKEPFRSDEYFLMLPDGETHALPPGSKLDKFDGIDLNHSTLKIQSSVWTGELRGSKLDLMEAKIIDRSGMRGTY